jgi:hypothetical protein
VNLLTLSYAAPESEEEQGDDEEEEPACSTVSSANTGYVYYELLIHWKISFKAVSQVAKKTKTRKHRSARVVSHSDNEETDHTEASVRGYYSIHTLLRLSCFTSQDTICYSKTILPFLSNPSSLATLTPSPLVLSHNAQGKR